MVFKCFSIPRAFVSSVCGVFVHAALRDCCLLCLVRSCVLHVVCVVCVVCPGGEVIRLTLAAAVSGPSTATATPSPPSTPTLKPLQSHVASVQLLRHPHPHPRYSLCSHTWLACSRSPSTPTLLPSAATRG